MSRAAIWTINVCLLVLCCFLAARVAIEVATGFLPGEVEALPQASPATAPGKKNWQDRQVILTRNLFNAKGLAPAQLTAAEVEESYAKSKLPLRLLGTVASSRQEDAWAAVEDTEQREHLVVRLKDKLKGRAEVIRIDPRRIVLLNAGRKEELSLDSEDNQPRRRRGGRTASREQRPRTRARASRVANSPRPSAIAPFSGAGQVRGPAGASAADIVNNPAALLSQARIVPKYENGEMVGMELSAIKPGSVFEAMGMQEGDTIRELNGIPVTDQSGSSQALAEMASSKSITVTVTGVDGATRQLQHEIR
jgi:general secretion pathway protein C